MFAGEHGVQPLAAEREALDGLNPEHEPSPGARAGARAPANDVGSMYHAFAGPGPASRPQPSYSERGPARRPPLPRLYGSKGATVTGFDSTPSTLATHSTGSASVATTNVAVPATPVTPLSAVSAPSAPVPVSVTLRFAVGC